MCLKNATIQLNLFSFQGKSCEISELSAMFNNDDTSKCRELKANAIYFYGNRITQVFNKICAFESRALLKPLKPRLWLPAFYAKPRWWLLAPNQLNNNLTALINTLDFFSLKYQNIFAICDFYIYLIEPSTESFLWNLPSWFWAIRIFKWNIWRYW